MFVCVYVSVVRDEERECEKQGKGERQTDGGKIDGQAKRNDNSVFERIFGFISCLLN